MPSEFYRLVLDTNPTPIDLEGAKQVTFQSLTGASIISNDESFNDYFTLSDSALTDYSLTIVSNDKRLFASALVTSVLEVWIVR